MSALQVPAPQADQERIDAMCAQFRSKIENLYSMAYLQGAIDQVEQDRAKMRGELARVRDELFKGLDSNA